MLVTCKGRNQGKTSKIEQWLRYQLHHRLKVHPNLAFSQQRKEQKQDTIKFKQESLKIFFLYFYVLKFEKKKMSGYERLGKAKQTDTSKLCRSSKNELKCFSIRVALRLLLRQYKRIQGKVERLRSKGASNQLIFKKLSKDGTESVILHKCQQGPGHGHQDGHITT